VPVRPRDQDRPDLLVDVRRGQGLDEHGDGIVSQGVPTPRCVEDDVQDPSSTTVEIPSAEP